MATKNEIIENSNRSESGGETSSSAPDHMVVPIPNQRRSSSKATNEIEADCLAEIESIPRLKLVLADWVNKFKESQSRIDRKETLSLNVKNEIYQLIGFFSVFQGVVLTTVSQASALTCHNWWGPFALSLLFSIATLIGVCNKIHNFFVWKRAAEKEVKNSQVLKTQINRLKKFGKNFNFAEHAPDQRDQKKEKRKICVEFEVPGRYLILALLVILCMAGFSAIILLSVYRILCRSGNQNIAPTSS